MSKIVKIENPKTKYGISYGYPYTYGDSLEEQEFLREKQEKDANISSFLKISLLAISDSMISDAMNETDSTGLIPFKNVEGVGFVALDNKLNFSNGSSFYGTVLDGCPGVMFLNGSKTMVMTDQCFAEMINGSHPVVDTVASGFQMSRAQAAGYLKDFLSKKVLLIQPRGVEGVIYRTLRSVQTWGSTNMVLNTVMAAKANGIIGLENLGRIIGAQPMIIVAVPAVGAMFFYSCGMIAGDTLVGRVCNTFGKVLNYPMLMCELVYNVYVSPSVHFMTGFNTTLNYTQQIASGPGLNSSEALKLLEQVGKTNLPVILGAKLKRILKLIGWSL